MFRKFLQPSSPESRVQALEEELDESPAGPFAPGIGERNRNDSSRNAKQSFEVICHRSQSKAATPPAVWDVLKVAGLIGNQHLPCRSREIPDLRTR